MPELDQLFTEFVERHLAGEEPDPWSYVDQLSGDEREELEELIDAYFVGAPPRSWDAAAYRGSSAERIADALDRSFRGQAGLWPAVLPRLRDRARLTRGALVRTLSREPRGRRPPREGGRLLPRDGAGPPALRGGVGPGTRRPGRDRRDERRGPAKSRRAAVRRAIGRGRGSGLRAPGEAGAGVRASGRGGGSSPTRTAPPSGTRWTSCSGAAERRLPRRADLTSAPRWRRSSSAPRRSSSRSRRGSGTARASRCRSRRSPTPATGCWFATSRTCARRPAARSSSPARPSPASCWPTWARSGSTPRRPAAGRRAAASRSATSSATGSCTEAASARSSAARRRCSPTSSPSGRCRRDPRHRGGGERLRRRPPHARPPVRREYERDRDFDRLCELFNCSGAAMGRRLHAVI